jgi:hypothetical protein
MKLVGELRNEITEHVTGSWKAVQQKQDRGVQTASLPVEYFDAINGYPAVFDFGHLTDTP